MIATPALALWWTAPFQAELRPVILGKGDAVVRMLTSGISRGTEKLVASGAVPESEWHRMRGPNQEGAFPFPVKYGYCAVGLVEAGPDHLLHRRVFCLHPHQDRFALPSDALTLVPDAVPTPRAILAANMETALNALWDAGALPGQRILVLGAGVLGALTAYLAGRLPGTEVTLVDPQGERAQLAAALGIAFATPDQAQGEADLVIEASGHAQALANALDLAGQEATVLVLGWHGTAPVPLPLGGAFHSRRLRLTSSQVGAVATAQRPRWSYARRIAKAMQLLDDPRLDALLSGVSRFADAPRDLPSVLYEPSTLAHRLSYGDE